MKRYMVFGGSQERIGGMFDFQCDYARLDEAIAAGMTIFPTCRWFHVYDTDSRTFVFTDCR